jgi:AcrR family transcriptional regulator
LAKAPSKLELHVPLPDGRRERSRSSRAKIVSAIMMLIEEGDPAPSAAKTAQSAGVGLRTVFRLFDDMDSLYQEITEVIEARVFPIMAQPLRGSNWRAKLIAAADRRAIIFEMIMPHRISASVRRFQSAYLLERYHRMVGLERAAIMAILPAHVLADKKRTTALHLALSFHSWRMMRQDENLSVKQAYAVIVQMVKDIIAHIPDEPASEPTN